MAQDSLQDIFTRYLQRKATHEDMEQLRDFLQQPGTEEQLGPIARQLWNEVKQSGIDYPVDWEHLYQSVIDHTQEKGPAPVVQIHDRRRFGWKRIAVAASVLIAVSTIGYFIVNKNKTKDPAAPGIVAESDVFAPDKNRAYVRLDDGKIVYLDSVGIGQLAVQQNIQLTKIADGKIVYSPSGTGDSKEVYNTLTNPRGSKVIDITLSDGSQVWLNAGSSITYPVAFAGDQRKVSITGEAYFEVAKDPSKKFIAEANSVNTEVLGTHFNINAYEDEGVTRITLLEGSVRVVDSEQSKVLKPDEQAVVNLSTIQLVNPDLDQVMAWKNGVFIFDRSDLKSVMRQLARWYDVEVEYRANVQSLTFGGGMEKTLSLSQVLKLLQQSEVHFKIEKLSGGREKIIVTP